MTGVAGRLSPLTNAWTTGTTWWLLTLAGVAALACVAARLPSYVRRVRDDPDARRVLHAGIATFLLALVLRLSLPPRVHYTFNDEYEYLDHAARLLASGAYRLWSTPPAGPYLWSIAFGAFGPSSDVAFLATIVAASATAPALAWLLRLLGVARLEALLAGVVLALAPLHVKHAASASLEVLSLLALLLALGTFVELLRRPGGVRATCFALALLLALTVRVENWLLLVLLPLVAWLWRDDARGVAPRLLVPALIALVLAALYLPGIADAPIRYDGWWKTRLPLGELLLVNLAFWTGGDASTRVLPVAIAVIGLVAALRRSPRAVALWLAFATLYSLAFALYGLNVGWVAEPHQGPPWGARDAGHDHFRFNVILLPVVAFLLASGIAALLRGARALLGGEGGAGASSRRVRTTALAGSCAAVLSLVVWSGEWRAYHPLRFVASTYNRGFEIAELRFLRGALAPLPRDAALYVLPPTEGVFVDGIRTRPLASLAHGRSHGAAYVYLNGRQLAVPQLGAAIADVQQRVALREIARRSDGRDRFFLLEVVGPTHDGG